MPTVHGDVDLVIPEGTQTGKKFRLRGKGVQAYVVVPWGDHMYLSNVVTPTGLNESKRSPSSLCGKQVIEGQPKERVL